MKYAIRNWRFPIVNRQLAIGNLQLEQDLGLKCSAWKVFGSKDFGLVGLYQKTKPDLFRSKKFGSEKFLVKKNFC